MTNLVDVYKSNLRVGEVHTSLLILFYGTLILKQLASRIIVTNEPIVETKCVIVYHITNDGSPPYIIVLCCHVILKLKIIPIFGNM